MELLDKFQKWCKKSKEFLNLEHCRPMVTGGYGLRMLSKHLRRVAPSEVTQTSDIDIHMNLRDTVYENDVETFKIYIKSKLVNWIKDFAKFSNTKIKNYRFYYKQVKIKTKTKVGTYHVLAMIGVKYKGDQFLDISISNEPYLDYLNIPIVNKNVFKTLGLPIKTVRGYKDEMFHVYFRETIRDLNKQTYVQRNPKNGIMKMKGQKDLVRLKFLCNLQKAINPKLYSDRRCVAFKKYVNPYIGKFTTKKNIEKRAKKVYAVIK